MTGADAYSISRIRRSIKAFAIGKVASATATFALLFALAAIMTQLEYASYIGATAVVDLGLSVGSLGLQWVANTTVPRIRVGGTVTQLKRAILALAAVQSLPYMLIGLVVYMVAPTISGLLGGVSGAEAIAMYGIVLAVEGLSRLFREQMLALLLLQGITQLVQLLRMLVVLAAVWAVHAGGTDVTAVHVAQAEIFASASTGLIAAAVLWAQLAKLPSTPGERADLSEWINVRESAKLAINAHGSFLLLMAFSTEVITTLVARLLGAEATALFGFASRLLNQVRKYLPSELLAGIIGPALIARYESSGRKFSSLASDTGRIVRLNTLIVSIAIYAVLSTGDVIIPILTRGNVDGSIAPLLAAMIVSLYGYTVRRAIELLTYPTGLSSVSVRGAIVSLIVPVLLVGALMLVPDLYVVAFMLFAGEVVFCWYVLVVLHGQGNDFHLQLGRFLRETIAVAIGAGAAMMISASYPSVPGSISATLAGGLLLLLLWLGMRVLTREDISSALLMVRRSGGNA